MRYRVVPWTLEHTVHREVVEELVDAGTEPAGCLVDDLTSDRAARIIRGYDKGTRSALLAQVGRPSPILLSGDRTTAVAVSDLHGSPSVRMRTFLADGSLVETERRWDEVPPWPRRIAAFRRFTTVEREMARSVAPGRSLLVSTGSAARQLDEHRQHVVEVAAARHTSPAIYPDMESVAAGWTAALAHEHAVNRRADRTVAAATLVLAVALGLILPTDRMAGAGWTVGLLAVVAVLFWATPGVVVLLRRRLRRRPAFVLDPASDVP